MMKLTIIIVNWNTCDLLDQCLRSIDANPPSGEFEIWIVDNGSTDRSLEMLSRAYPAARVIANAGNVGFARANNQGMRQAQGQAFLLLNSDTLVRPGALDGLLRVLDEIPQAGVVGCKLLNQDGSLQESWAQFPTLASEFLGRNFRGRRQVPGRVGLYQADWVGGACMLVRKEAAQQVGLFDESFFMYSEEVDWCYRMSVQGWKTFYLESAEIIHLGGGSASRTSLSQLVRLYDSKLRFFKKNYGLWYARCLRIELILANLLRMAGRGLAGLARSRQMDEQSKRIHTQWQLIRWLWAGNWL